MTWTRHAERIYVAAGSYSAGDNDTEFQRPSFEIVQRQPFICSPKKIRWGWVLRARNNRVVAHSIRDYSSEHHARRAVHEIMRDLFDIGFVLRKSGEK